MKLKHLATTALLAAAFAVAAPHAHAADTADQDKKFVADGGEGSLFEVEVAKLALTNSTNADVRGFAQKMIHDHTMLIAQMKPFAAKMSVPPPSTNDFNRAQKDEYERLSKKKGEEFDKDYLNTMILDHQKDVEDFKKERDITANPALKAAVAKGEKVVEGHYNMLEMIAKKYNLPTHA